MGEEEQYKKRSRKDAGTGLFPGKDEKFVHSEESVSTQKEKIQETEERKVGLTFFKEECMKGEVPSTFIHGRPDA
jgi:hypothetical protein